MKQEDLRLRSWYGEGYYSGASRYDVLVYDINDKELLENQCKFFIQEERYMGELDGKHSEVRGDVSEEDIDDFESIIHDYCEKDNDVFNDEFWKEEDTEVYKALKKAYDFVNKYSIKKVYKNIQTGEILDMTEYEQIKIVVEK